ncbi:MAG: metallophosphoesterase [Candidatus Bathyarchaeia archaeon]|jgi:Icc-related predicted phosphoesterase
MGEEKKFTKIYYATDIHGSNRAFKKFVKAAKFYKADVLVLGGDITGKMIVPMVKQRDGSIKTSLFGQEKILKDETEAKIVEGDIRDSGYYPFYSSQEEINEIEADKSKLKDLFTKLMHDSVVSWVDYTQEQLKGTNVICYITGGNDDHQSIVDAIKETDNVKNPDNRVVQIDGLHEMVSIGWSNPTPWKSPRECSEEDLSNRINALVSQVDNMENCVFNFHAPPLNCVLDVAPLLDTSVYPPKAVLKLGQQVLTNVGSSSVRVAIEKYQPPLVLCGHIHESNGVCRIGKSLVINPGSEYGEGILKGAIVNLADKKVLSYQLVSG